MLVSLEQMLLALLENACKHNTREHKIIWLHATDTHDAYSVVISDNGPGIPEQAKLNHLNIVQRKGGLGLHLCRLISDKYGATINLLNRVDGHPEL